MAPGPLFTRRLWFGDNPSHFIFSDVTIDMIWWHLDYFSEETMLWWHMGHSFHRLLFCGTWAILFSSKLFGCIRNIFKRLWFVVSDSHLSDYDFTDWFVGIRTIFAKETMIGRYLDQFFFANRLLDLLAPGLFFPKRLCFDGIWTIFSRRLIWWHLGHFFKQTMIWWSP